MAPMKAPAVKLKYTNRKSDGLKLAAIVSKDLRKHATSFGKKSTVTDNDSAPLELDLEHKDQTDICVEAFVASLNAALAVREGISPLRLEELNLRGNGLTSTSLRLLAPVIRSARFDLHDVDLSRNAIQVTTRREAKDFAMFLQAFAGCELMRRLDLSENDFSGPLAMEVMLRVYCQQPPVDPSLLYYQNGPGGRDSDYEILNEKANGLHLSSQYQEHSYPEDMEASSLSLTQAKVLQRRRGLRAIPYILFKDTKMDDAGALHFSYVLEQHHWPQYLMTKLKDGSREAKRKEEDDLGGSFGLVYSANPSLSTYGSKLLDYANAARAKLVGIQASPQTPQGSWVDPMKVGPLSGRSRKMSTHSSLSDDVVDGRLSSPSANMHSLRMRLQRTTLEEHGLQSVQLWHAAMKVLYAARVILPPTRSQPSNGITSYVSNLTVTSAAPEAPIFSITGETAEQSAPTITDFSRRAVSLPGSQRSLLQTSSNGTNGSSSLINPIQVEKQSIRDIRNPMGLPTDVWRKIFVRYARGAAFLNNEQVDKIIGYARDRSNIMMEYHSQAKGNSHQVWHVLEQIDCFTYELKTDRE